jgi:hypothetical protein
MNSCSKTELRKFKARAGRRQPAEYIETLWGFKTGRDHDIQAIRLVPHRGTRNVCQPGIDAWNRHLEEVAKATGMQFLGTIHTHNDEIHDEGPSPSDNLSALETGERIFAIDCIRRLPSGRLKHVVKFWYPQAPVENIQLT